MGEFIKLISDAGDNPRFAVADAKQLLISANKNFIKNAICEEPSIERAALRTGQGCGIDGNCYFSAILLGNSWTRAVWGWSITSWGVPCSRIAPLSTKTTRSDTFLANRISCVTIIIVTPVPATLIENCYRNTLRLLENS